MFRAKAEELVRKSMARFVEKELIPRAREIDDH